MKKRTVKKTSEKPTATLEEIDIETDYDRVDTDKPCGRMPFAGPSGKSFKGRSADGKLVSIEMWELTPKKYGQSICSTYWINLDKVCCLSPNDGWYEMFLEYGGYYKRFAVSESEWRRVISKTRK